MVIINNGIVMEKLTGSYLKMICSESLLDYYEIIKIRSKIVEFILYKITGLE